MQIDDLNAAVAKLQANVATLLASAPVSTGDTDLQPAIDALSALDAQVVAATPAGSGSGPVAAAKVNPTFGARR